MNEVIIVCLGVSDQFKKKLSGYGRIAECGECSIAIFGENCTVPEKSITADRVICLSGIILTGGRVLCDEIITASMSSDATVTLTGIADDRCMLAFNRYATDIKGCRIEINETPHSFDNSMSNEENLLYLTAKTIIGQ
ncbi:MAG TPA: hypothetical protein PLT66_05390 [Bacillota bacterium]|nr:hypothetical protein [Bacillota bacterium]